MKHRVVTRNSVCYLYYFKRFYEDDDDDVR